MFNIRSSRSDHDHVWITVVNPTNQRKLLQACDNCGIVKSENSIIRSCKAAKNSGLISSAMSNSRAEVS